ncbi:MAG: hypothetical protein H7A33_00340 [Deltaproteobacteria bacterium]|nr:hypothetical protein [Deltaproteobacteria bacterium]
MSDSNQNNDGSGRKFLGIKFECCGTYARVYLNEKMQAYMGACPRCCKRVKILVDKEKATTDKRFFVAK